MGTPVDFWSLEDCVKTLSELSETRAIREETLEKVRRSGEDDSNMSGYSNNEDAIRQLLVEKERDLELAAQIGSRLLEQNKELEQRLEGLDKQLLSANDRAQQLRHELVQKEQLVQVYSQICEEAQGDEVWPATQTPPTPSPQHSSLHDAFSPRSSRRGALSTGLDQLQMQISMLEDENRRLRREHDTLASRGDKTEKTAVEDCLRQLAEANSYIRNLSEDLSKKTDKFMERQSDVTNLFSRSTEMEQRVKLLTNENASLNERLSDAQSSQNTLTTHLVDLRDKYDQCLTMLGQAHSEIRRVQSQQQQQQQHVSPLLLARGPSPGSATAPAIPMTLAAELEESLLAEVEVDDPALPQQRRSSYPWNLRPQGDSSSDSSTPSSDDDEPVKLRRGHRRPPRRHHHHQRSAKRLHPSQAQPPSQALRMTAPQQLQDKVQMVKSMEGSSVLRQWQRLARPSMSGALFERRSGIRVRGCSGTRNNDGGLGGLGGLVSSESEDESSASAPVSFGLGGLGFEASSEKHLPHRDEADEEAVRAEVEAITYRMSSEPPDPRRSFVEAEERRPPSLPRSDTSEAPISSSGMISGSSLTAILSEKGIRSKTYSQLVGEGFPMPPPVEKGKTVPPPPPCPATPRNSPTAEVEGRFEREQSSLTGPVNPTLVFAGLLESLSEIFKPFSGVSESTTSLRSQSSSVGDLRRNFSAGANLDGGLNLVAAQPMKTVASVVHRTDSSVVSPRKK